MCGLLRMKTGSEKQGRDLLFDIKNTFSFFNNRVANGGKLVKIMMRRVWKNQWGTERQHGTHTHIDTDRHTHTHTVGIINPSPRTKGEIFVQRSAFFFLSSSLKKGRKKTSGGKLKSQIGQTHNFNPTYNSWGLLICSQGQLLWLATAWHSLLFSCVLLLNMQLWRSFSMFSESSKQWLA